MYLSNRFLESTGACIFVLLAPINKSYFVVSVEFFTTHAITSLLPLVYDASHLASALVGTFLFVTKVIELIKSTVYFVFPALLAPIA